MKQRKRIAVLDFLRLVHWLDGSPILPRIEPYRRAILSDVLDTPDATGTGLRYNLAFLGRAKKNAKSLDLVLAALFACVANESVLGNECYVVASDEGQARDDLQLAKKLVTASPHLSARLTVREKSLLRKDGRGFVMVLPGQDVAGSHGKTVLSDWRPLTGKPVAQQRQLLRKLVPDRLTVTPHVDAKRKWVDWAGDLAVAPIISGIAPAVGDVMPDGMDGRWWPQRDSNPCFSLERAVS